MSGPSVDSIERVRGLSYQEFADRYDRSTHPVVVIDAIASWPALRKWSQDWFRRHYGEQRVVVAVGPRLESLPETMRLCDYLASIHDGTNYGQAYLRQYPILHQIPELAADFQTPIFCPSDRRVITNLWIGPANTIQPFHKDNHNPIAILNGLLAQLEGRKRVVLVSAAYDAAMYPRSPTGRDYHHSQIDLDHVDFERFPLFRSAHLLETTLEPGDMLFIPGDTWHYVRALEPSISLSFWWHPVRVVDLIARLAAGELPTSTAFTVTSEDVNEIGGLETFQRALGTLPLLARARFVDLCDREVRAMLNL